MNKTPIEQEMQSRQRRIIIPSTGKSITRVNLKSMDDSFTIIAAGDFHIGAEAFNEFAFHTFVKQVVAEANRRQVRIILMGDLFDSITTSDKRYYKAQQQSTMDEAQDFVRGALKPLITHKNIKFVGSLIGNHEIKYCGGDSDPIYRMYENTGIQPLGSRAYMYFDLVVGGKVVNTFRTVAFHGASNSRLEQGKLRIVREFLKENELTYDEFVRLNHLALFGHTHATRVEEITRCIPIPRLGKFVTIRQWSCLTGTFHDSGTFNKSSYSADKGYNAMPVGYIRVRVSPNKNPTVEAVTEGLNPMVSDMQWGSL